MGDAGRSIYNTGRQGYYLRLHAPHIIKYGMPVDESTIQGRLGYKLGLHTVPNIKGGTRPDGLTTQIRLAK